MLWELITGSKMLALGQGSGVTASAVGNGFTELCVDTSHRVLEVGS